jgi:hypothetical protein
MSEKLSISQLKDEVSMYDEFVEIPVTINEKEYTVKMFPYFKPEKIRDLVNELHDFLKAAQKEKLTVPSIEEDDLVGFFIVKYFTNLASTKSKKAKTIYNEFKLALNSKLFKVLMKTYPKESIGAVYDRIYDVLEANAELKDRFKDYQDVIRNLPIENKEIIK